MHLSKISGFAVAAFFAAASTAMAQTSPQTPTQTPTPTTTQTPTQTTQPQTPTQPQTSMPTQTPTTPQSPTMPATPAQSTSQQMKSNDKDDQAAVQTFTGCLMTETAYRRAHQLGSGAANGLGLGDEFVITDVKVSPANGATDMTPATPPAPMSNAAASSTSTCADKGVAYRLTGTAEEKIKPMNIVGREIEVQGRFKHADDVTASGAPTSGNLPAEVEIVSFHEVPAPAAAPAATAEPAPSQPLTMTPQRSTAAPVTTPSTPEPTTPAPTATTEPRELPHTASSTGLIAMIGAFALGSGLFLAVWRRRIV